MSSILLLGDEESFLRCDWIPQHIAWRLIAFNAVTQRKPHSFKIWPKEPGQPVTQEDEQRQIAEKLKILIVDARKSGAFKVEYRDLPPNSRIQVQQVYLDKDGLPIIGRPTLPAQEPYVNPVDFFAWAESKGFPIPDEWEAVKPKAAAEIDVAVIENIDITKDGFSKDRRYFTWHGKAHVLSGKQAKIVDTLYRGHKGGVGVEWDNCKRDAGIIGETYMKDSFRNHATWKEFIEKVQKTRDIWRLKD